MKMRQLVCTIAGMLALAGLSGCKTDEKHSSELSDGRMVDDKHITERVEDGLKSDPVYKFGDINVSTYGGLVQLAGFVNTEGEKERAQSIAQNVPGVIRVENGIALKPTPPAPTGRTNQNSKIYSQ
jgi:hyperosmotically inducible protein